MITPPETRFFAALAAALSARPGAAAGVADLARAAANGDPAAVAETQRALAALSEADRDAVLAETHRRLREDVAAIWDLLPGAPRQTRPN